MTPPNSPPNPKPPDVEELLREAEGRLHPMFMDANGRARCARCHEKFECLQVRLANALRAAHERIDGLMKMECEDCPWHNNIVNDLRQQLTELPALREDRERLAFIREVSVPRLTGYGGGRDWTLRGTFAGETFNDAIDKARASRETGGDENG